MARQNFIGLVVSQGKMQKTVKVRVQTKKYDNKVFKETLSRKDYLVHDEGNICKEGDIVRIEAIPKISARKYFAIAEIKVNKGQQFALYESLARERVLQEKDDTIRKYFERRQEVQTSISKIEDLKKIDDMSFLYQADPEADRDFLLKEIESIKQKYNIQSWPSVEPVLQLETSQVAQELSTIEGRFKNMKSILDKLMAEEHLEKRKDILSKISKKPIEELKPNIQKNILRKYLMDSRNECPVAL